MDLRTLRKRMMMSLQDVSRLTTINISRLSMIERALIAPSDKESILLRRLFIDYDLDLKSRKEATMSVPAPPVPMWTNDGRPDFSQFEGDDEKIQENRRQRYVENRKELFANNFGVPDPKGE